MRLYDILACPVCRGELALAGNEEGLACAACDKVFPIREGIPVLLVDEAVPTKQWNMGKRQVQITCMGGKA